jgi:protein-disulfide isomerase
VQTGQVRFGYAHFAFLGEESFWAAEASECAADQDKFWEYHDLLFESQAGENQGAFSKDRLKALAGALDLDQTAFDECLDSGKHAETIRRESQAASQLGVRSTPTFVINGQPITGAQPFEVFQEIIDGLLAGR